MARRGKKKTNLRNFLDEDLKKELKEELKEEIKEELKKELGGGLNIEFIDDKTPRGEEIKKAKEESVSPEKKRKRRYVRVLVLLVIIILVLDLFSFYLYYKPNLNFLNSVTSKVSSGFSGLATKKCKDGTAYDTCSKDKPYYCYEGELLKKAFTCGCPGGYKVDFQDCKKI